MIPLSEILASHTLATQKAPKEEYEYLLNEARKMTGMSYIVMHARLRNVPISLIRDWVYESEKSDNKGRSFNARLKWFNEQKKLSTPSVLSKNQ